MMFLFAVLLPRVSGLAAGPDTDSSGRLPGRALSLRVVLGLVLVAGSTAGAAEPLSQLVAADVGLYIEIHDLDATLPQLVESRFHQRLRRNRLFLRWQEGREYQKLQQAGRAIAEAAEMPAERVLRELFGDAAALAVYRRNGRDPVGILIGRAVSDAALDRALDVWRRLDTRARLTTEHRGIGYVEWRSLERADEQRQFFVRVGPLFALSDSEWAVQRWIDLQLQATGMGNGPPLSTLNDLAEYEAAREDLSEKRLLHVFLNPAIWQGELPEDLPLVQACQSVVADVRVDDALTVNVVARLRGEPVPGWDAAMPAPDRLGQYLERVPRRVLLMAVGCQNWSALAERLERHVEGRRDTQVFRQFVGGVLLQKDPLTDVLSRLDPDWGLAVVPGVSGAPPGLWLGLGLPDDAVENGLVQGIENALQTVLRMGVAFGRETPGLRAIAMQSDRRGEITLHWLSGLPLVRPAGTVSSRDLIVGTDPDAVRAALQRPTERLVDRPEFQSLRETYLGSLNQLVYVDLEVLREELQANVLPLARWIARSSDPERPAASERLQRLQDLLALCDRLYLGAELRPRRLRLVLGGWCGPSPDSAPSVPDRAPSE